MGKKVRTIVTMALSLAMVLSMSIGAFAATDTGEDKSHKPSDNNKVISKSGVLENGQDAGDGTHGVYTAVGGTVTLHKEIIVFNTRTDQTLVYLPNITYNYAVEAVTPAENKAITDEYELKGTVNPGVAAAITTPSVSIEYSNTSGITGGSSNPYVITDNNGVAAAGKVDISFDASKFSRPGIYRYKVTESTAADARAQAGVTNTSYDATRYIDVYVQNNSANTGYEIYGIVIFETGSADSEFDAADAPLNEKTNGFVSDQKDTKTESYSRTEESVDIYETSNVKIVKQVEGTLGDKNNEFPFEATLTNSVITNNAKFSYQVVGDSTAALNTAATTNPSKVMANGTATVGSASATVADGFKLDDDDYILIYGVPGKNQATTFISKEYNNTQEIYKVSGDYDSAAINMKSGSTTAEKVDMLKEATAETAAAQTMDITKAEDILTVTNTLYAISPTNLVLRYAPYLIMLIGGLLILMASRERREEN